MKLICILLLFLLNFRNFRCKQEVCYKSLGCFEIGKPFGGTLIRPIVFRPSKLEEINLQFQIYNNLADRLPIRRSWNETLPTFEKNKKVYFVVHGFIQSGSTDWMIRMKDALLQREKCSVIIVDWHEGNRPPYGRATSNTRVVGRIIAQKLNSFKALNNVVLIGHSLGAHICGYAGKYNGHVKYIIGLDPAGPYFENTPKIVRLDKSDAEFVQIIHSNGLKNIELGLGLYNPIGSLDIYLNDGKEQPGCKHGVLTKVKNLLFETLKLNIDGIEDAVGCDHMAACNFLISAISQTCKYFMYSCDKYENMVNGVCQLKNERIDYSVNNFQPQGTKYLLTGSFANAQNEYCLAKNYIGFQSLINLRCKIIARFLGGAKEMLYEMDFKENKNEKLALKTNKWVTMALVQSDFNSVIPNISEVILDVYSSENNSHTGKIAETLVMNIENVPIKKFCHHQDKKVFPQFYRYSFKCN
ncbi:hypothetical protein SNEBB_004545 [Seison nebaliae]|nr:hypothetical protein SNEBB_004545 [Seison nebaliae]